MRTTLDIDDDVLAAAKERAASQKTTAGRVLSELARQALTQSASERPPVRQDFILKDGWYVLPSRGAVVTNELIDKIQDEMDREDARAAGCERPPGVDG